MVLPNPKAWLGRGIYPIPEAASLIDASAEDLRRWAFGYQRKRGDETMEYPPLILAELPVVDGQYAVTFVEMVELMYIRGFTLAGAPWRLIKHAAKLMARLHQTEHPFAMREFFADPDGIYTKIEEHSGDPSLLRLVGHGQHEIRPLVQPLLGQLDFGVDDLANRWWPLHPDRGVVLDPMRSFGAPLVAEVGIPTRTLTGAFDAEEDGDHARRIRSVAWLYEVEPAHVEVALRFRNWMRRSRSGSSSTSTSRAA